jgi:hypothetical protein
LIERAILELNRAQSPPLLAPFIDRVRTRSRTQVRTELHSLLDQSLTSVSARQRGKIEEKINDLLDGHTENILQTISDYAPTPSQEK